MTTVETFLTGTKVEQGSFCCVDCGFPVTVAAGDSIPDCPNCGSAGFRRSSLFETVPTAAHLEPLSEGEPDWLEELRGTLSDGHHLAFSDGDLPKLISLSEGWIRIGRSAAADIQLDDPTVSRRHALLVVHDDGSLRVLDDRSLNGLYVNGERVEWSVLGDRDELTIGRYRLHVIDAVTAGVAN